MAFVLSIIFTSITVLPNIMAMVDNTYDISVLIDSSEEEEKKGEEKGKDLEIEILENIKQDFTLKLTSLELVHYYPQFIF